MKIAILSDIHGNLQALEAVLDDIKNNKCEKIFCLGDLAMAGPQPDEVIDFIKKQNWEIIQGNTDELIANYSEDLYKTVKVQFPVMANALANDFEIINNENKEYLQNLPKNLKLEVEGVKILLVHGSPRKNNENIFPNLPIEEVEKMIEGVDEDLIFCGHTHVPCGYQTNNKKTVVNVGSIGRPMTKNPQSCYVIANFENGKFSIEHRFVDYDREKASKLMKKRNFEGSEKIAEMLITPSEPHI